MAARSLENARSEWREEVNPIKKETVKPEPGSPSPKKSKEDEEP